MHSRTKKKKAHDLLIAQLIFGSCGLSPKFLPATSRALGRFDARRWA